MPEAPALLGPAQGLLSALQSVDLVIWGSPVTRAEWLGAALGLGWWFAMRRFTPWAGCWRC